MDNQLNLGNQRIRDNSLVFHLIVDIKQRVRHGFKISLAGISIRVIQNWFYRLAIGLDLGNIPSKFCDGSSEFNELVVFEIVKDVHYLRECCVEVGSALGGIGHVKALEELIFPSSKQVLKPLLILGALDFQFINVIHNLGNLGHQGIGVNRVIQHLFNNSEHHISSVLSISCAEVLHWLQPSNTQHNDRTWLEILKSRIIAGVFVWQFGWFTINLYLLYHRVDAQKV